MAWNVSEYAQFACMLPNTASAVIQNNLGTVDLFLWRLATSILATSRGGSPWRGKGSSPQGLFAHTCRCQSNCVTSAWDSLPATRIVANHPLHTCQNASHCLLAIFSHYSTYLACVATCVRTENSYISVLCFIN